MSSGAPTIGGLERLDDYLAGQRKWEVDISGGEISNVNLINCTIDTPVFTLPVDVASGGTGADNASDARDNLGLTIGTNVQAYDAGLQSIAGLTTAADTGIYTTSADNYATFTLTAAGRSLLDDADTTAQRATLGLTIGTNVQAYDDGLQSIAGLTTAADKGIYTTASDTYATFDLTAAGRALLDDASASDQRTTLGLGTAATQNTGTSGANIPLLNANNTTSGNNTHTGTETFSNATGVTTDTVTERTSAAGVTIDGVLLKDGGITTTATGSTAVTRLGHGTYTPTLTNVTNLDSSTAVLLQYCVVGDFVTVSGQFNADPTAIGLTELRISLPIASNFSGASNAGGTFRNSSSTVQDAGVVIADGTNDQLLCRWIATVTSNQSFYFTCGYRII